MRASRFFGGSLVAVAFLAACSDTQLTAPGTSEALSPVGQAGAACQISDNAARQIRTISGSCGNSDVLVPAGWTLRTEAGTGSNDVIVMDVTPIENPTPEYIDATSLIDISGIADFTQVSSISDGTLTVNFSISLDKRSVPGSWGTWANPPFVEPGTPHILWTQGSETLTMNLSSAVTTFGFELGPNPFAFHTFTAEYYAGATLVGSITRQISGDNGARLMAVASTEAFDRVVVTGDADFSIGRVRYGTGQVTPPTDVDVDRVYSGDPARAAGIVSLEDDYLYVEILDVEQYLGRPASADDVRIGSSFGQATPAQQFQILDINGDGNRDIRLRWSIDELVADGQLSLQTQRLVVWGRDQTGEDVYRGTAEVEVIMGDVAIDQNQPSAAVYMAAFDQTDLAQSFQTQQDRPTSGAGVFLQAGVGSTDNVTIQLWDGLPNAGGTMLAQGSAQGTQGQWVDVFWSPVDLTPNTTYYLVFTGNFTLGIAGDITNPYPHGHVFANPGFQAFPGFDYTFRTWISVEEGGMSQDQAQRMRTAAPHGSAGMQRSGCAATSGRSCF